MLEMLLSAGGGGLFGLLGSAGKMFAAYKEKKLIFSHEVQMAEQTRRNMEMEMQLATLQGQIDLELQESENDAKNLQAAINAEAAVSGASAWVNDLRSSVRPILTYGLSVLAISMAWTSPENPWLNEIIFLASTAVTFWFGTRPYKSQ